MPKIREALNFMRNHSFEVPFIANYRKEYVEPELDIHDLWTIWQSDEKVCLCVHDMYMFIMYNVHVHDVRTVCLIVRSVCSCSLIHYWCAS